MVIQFSYAIQTKNIYAYTSSVCVYINILCLDIDHSSSSVTKVNEVLVPDTVCYQILPSCMSMIRIHHMSQRNNHKDEKCSIQNGIWVSIIYKRENWKQLNAQQSRAWLLESECRGQNPGQVM